MAESQKADALQHARTKPRGDWYAIGSTSSHETYQNTPLEETQWFMLLGPGRCGESPRGHWVNRCGC